MAASWVPAETDLARKPKVLAMARAGGICRHAATGLLIDFWGYVSEEANEGFIAGVTLDDLPSIVGGSSSFWQAVCAAGWIAVKDDGLLVPDNQNIPWVKNGAKSRLLNARRQAAHRITNSNAPSNGPPLRNVTHPPLPEMRHETYRDLSHESQVLDFDFSAAFPIASKLYRDTASTKGDDPFLWQIATLVAFSKISEAEVSAALSASKSNAKGDKVAYFRRSLEREVGGKKQLKDLLRMVRITKAFPRNPPESSAMVAPTFGRLDE